MDEKLYISDWNESVLNSNQVSFEIANQDVVNLLSHTTDYLIENREKLSQKYGWKTYGILLAQSMGYNVPQFFPIPTDFWLPSFENYQIENSDEGFVFNLEQIEYLEKIFSKFSDHIFISVRSSANIEDMYSSWISTSWAFYTWFSDTKDFDNFLLEVKKVLLSKKNVYLSKVDMWVLIMAVTWEKQYDSWFAPDWSWIIRGRWNDFVQVTSQFWLPVWVTSWKAWCITNMFDKSWELNNRIKTTHQQVWFDLSHMSRNDYIYSNWILSDNYKRATCLSRRNSINNSFWNFDLYLYQKLVKILNEIEDKIWISVEIEFVVHDNIIYVIQIKPIISSNTKPKGFSDTPNKGILYWADMYREVLWFYDWECELYDLDCVRFNHRWFWSSNLSSNIEIFSNHLNDLEKRRKDYFIYINWLDHYWNFLSWTNLRNYTHMKWVICKVDKYSHMIPWIIELWLPVIFLYDRFDEYIYEWRKYIYINQEKWTFAIK